MIFYIVFRKARLSFALFLFLLIVPNLHGQLQNSHWHFGTHASLIIDTSSVQEYHQSQVDAYEACASICDHTGSILLYVDDSTAFNGNDQILNNGTGLLAHRSSTQGSLIVPMPSNPTTYYLFQRAGLFDPRAYYSVIDLAGNGAILQKNVSLAYPVTEKISGTLHENGEDYWIIMKEMPGNAFLAYHLHSSGLDTVPVISYSGSEILWSSQQAAGYMRANREGDKIAYGIRGKDLLEICDFDDQTGIVSNCATLDTVPKVYGVEFSNDGSKLYCTDDGPIVGDSIFIYQFDLQNGSIADIRASKFTVASGALQTGGVNSFGALALAPDKKIYVNRPITNWLSVINDPDSSGVACNYVDAGVELSTGQCTFGLPNQIKKYAEVADVIAEYDGVPVLDVYPNPAHDQFYVQYSNTSTELTFDLFDLTGRVVLSEEFGIDDSFLIRRGDLEPGLYQGIVRERGRIAGSFKVIFK